MQPETAHTRDVSRLVLGTAQFGAAYGVVNQEGKPTRRRVKDIVQAAWQAGMRTFDTAQGYGDSESVLGLALAQIGIAGELRIITKLDPGLDCRDVDAVQAAAASSLEKLKIKRLYGVLLHREAWLDQWQEGVRDSFERLKQSGLTEYVGVSVYSPEKAIQAVQTAGIDLVQLPSSILDRRFEKAGVFRAAAADGTRLFVRSVFLQGLLLADPEETPPEMAFCRGALAQLAHFRRKTGLSAHELALAYVRDAYPEAAVVFGVETVEQLRRNVVSWGAKNGDALVRSVQTQLADIAADVVDPRQWPPLTGQ